MHIRRPASILIGLALIAACSARAPEQPNTQTPTRSPAATSFPSKPRTQSPSSSPGSGLPGTPSAAPSIPGASYDDAGPLGAMARTFLRSSPARRLIVEVDWVAGRTPGDGALRHLEAVLQSVCDKPGGVSVRRGSEARGSRSTWSIDDIKRLESSARANRSSGDTATIWIVYLDGSLKDAPNALGVAFEASGGAIFRDRIDEATTALLLASEIERSVITHEVGHLLALVNIGYKSRLAHEDPEHPHHSNNRDSVMYWAVDDTSIGSLLGGGPPDDFDDADRADLRQLKSG